MFTGIVEELGSVEAVEPSGDGARLTIRGPQVLPGTRHGDSVAVNGVCLTVVDVGAGAAEGCFTAEAMQVTLERSNLGSVQPGDRVNLERPVTPQGRLGGHLVQGHVDGTTRVLSRSPGERWDVVRFALPEPLARYLVDRGSITVDGVSLTVSALGDAWFEVSLIPTTLAETTLGARRPGALVNLEVDVIAKYVAKHLEHLAGSAR